MADYNLLQSANDDDIEFDGGDVAIQNGNGIDSYSEYDIDTPEFTQENLSRLERIRKNVKSENNFDRQLSARSLMDTLREILETKETTVDEMMEIMEKLSNDCDYNVRCDMVQQIPQFSLICKENSSINECFYLHGLPILKNAAIDQSHQVRKTTETAILVLLENNLLSKDDIFNEICPILIKLAESDIDEIRIESVSFIAKAVEFLGYDVAKNRLFDKFCSACEDSVFHIRKAAANVLGVWCELLGFKEAEEYIIPLYLTLCKDEVWGVRKSCIEVFVLVAKAVSSDLRRTKLKNLYVEFLTDQSRWVRLAAYEGLGAFIATFALPSAESGFDVIDGSLVKIFDEDGDDISTLGNFENTNNNATINFNCNYDEYNSFEFWRQPLPEVDLSDIVEKASENIVSSDGNNNSGNQEVKRRYDVNDALLSSALEEGVFINDNAGYNRFDPFIDEDFNLFEDETSSKDSSICRERFPNSMLAMQQDVVPHELLEHFLSMGEQSTIQNVDMDIARSCAFSFPAVAFTLGRKNWHCLRHLYKKLGQDQLQQWKVKRSLANSIHELVQILGTDITVEDITPVFDFLYNEADEIRCGILKNLPIYLSYLPAEERLKYLPRFSEFVWNNQGLDTKNWRFREQLANRLMYIVPLFTPNQVSENITNIALKLIKDSVNAVRQMAAKLIARILKHVVNLDNIFAELCKVISSDFANSENWRIRQIYVVLCEEILLEKLLPAKLFECYFLPYLLKLADDIISIRIVLARCFKNCFCQETSVISWKNNKSIAEKIMKLETDPNDNVKDILT